MTTRPRPLSANNARITITITKVLRDDLVLEAQSHNMILSEYVGFVLRTREKIPGLVILHKPPEPLKPLTEKKPEEEPDEEDLEDEETSDVDEDYCEDCRHLKKPRGVDCEDCPGRNTKLRRSKG